MINEDHQRLKEDLAVYALDGLDPAVTARIDDHLRQCPECQGILREYHAVVDLLPFALPATQPSEDGLRTLKRRIRTEGRQRSSHSAHERRRLWSWVPARSRLVPLVAIIGLIVILLAGFGLWWQQPVHDPATAIQQLRTRNDVQVVNLVGQSSTSAHGELLFTPDLAHAAVAVNDLPPLPRNRVYQVWFSRADRTWMSGGVFRVDTRGDAEVSLRLPPADSAYFGCWITVEPQGGSPTPSGPLVLSTFKP